ncbi:MAG: DUF853 family protein [Planctomycetes bacterium]|nr:DUF853 family protein [Planctomycetota bacterium]
MQNFEGLGTFYLGGEYDLARGARTGELLLYDSKDLVTHAVCVGMTGSGKTGLCTTLIEEAALDGIPVLVIDPKGDLANLMLGFPELRASDFAPWIDPAEAQLAQKSVEQLAAETAERWTRGLATWGQDGERIRRLHAAAEFAVYTPGSSAARSLSIVESFRAPSEEEREDVEGFRERVATTVSSLLALAGVDGDPLKSRGHILLSTIVQRAWSEGRDLELGALIGEVQDPKLQRIGVFDLESFYPAKERFELALELNNLLASPGFAAWMEGEPLDIDALLYTKAGKPRVAILSIAHLSDAQRMFFVSLLLNQVLAWVRRQRGTNALRALVYMDEIAGYFPPVANPPSKAPLLTLMKQARAFGVGIVLATQNPVDLDYKGLANAGTWFVGRLQTERDKARLLDGLEGAAATAGGAFDRAEVERTLSSLTARVFLMNNVHEDRPVIFETRWALSFLRGPMTRVELKALAQRARSAAEPVTAAPTPAQPTRPATPAPVTPVTPGTPVHASTSSSPASAASRPVLPPEVPQYFAPVRGALGNALGGAVEYRPALLGSAKVFFSDAKSKLESDALANRICGFADGPVVVDWERAESVELDLEELESEPMSAPMTGASGASVASAARGASGGNVATFAALPADAAKPRSYDAWKKSFADALFRTQTLGLWRHAELELVGAPGESERDFRLRVDQAAREDRDRSLARLREKFAPKLALLEERKRKREQSVDVQAAQARDAKVSTALSFGSALLGMVFGRKSVSGSVGRAATAARGVSRSARESGDVARAEEDVRAVTAELTELQSELEAALAAETGRFAGLADAIERVTLRPKKTAVQVRALVLVWLPYRVPEGGEAAPAWR